MNLRHGYIDRFPLYRFGSDGRVWHWKLKRLYWKEVRHIVGKQTGYPAVCIRNFDTDTRQLRPVHLLVSEAFLGPAPPGQECRHRDGNKLNPSLSNLAYGTHRENEADKVRHGTKMHGETHHQVKLTEADVIAIRGPLASAPLPELAKLFSVTPQAIWRIRHRRTWRHVA